MNIEKTMHAIVDDLQKNAMPFESYAYGVKSTHQIIRKHLIKLNNEKRDVFDFSGMTATEIIEMQKEQQQIIDKQQKAEMKINQKHYYSADEPCPDCGLLLNENGWCDCWQGDYLEFNT